MGETKACPACYEKDRTIQVQKVLLDSVFRPEQSTLRMRIAEVADSLDNLLAAQALPLPLHLQLKGVVENLPPLRDTLRSMYVDIAGENPWEDEAPPHA